MSFYRKILIVFTENIGLTITSDLVGFKHILCLSKIQGSRIP